MTGAKATSPALPATAEKTATSRYRRLVALDRRSSIPNGTSIAPAVIREPIASPIARPAHPILWVSTKYRAMSVNASDHM
jgi:hypothetical protein